MSTQINIENSNHPQTSSPSENSSQTPNPFESYTNAFEFFCYIKFPTIDSSIKQLPHSQIISHFEDLWKNLELSSQEKISREYFLSFSKPTKKFSVSINNKKRKQKSDLTENEIISIKNFINEMRERAFSDRASNIRKQPALGKTNYLSELNKFCLNKRYWKTLLKNNILCKFCEWISPLPDGSLVGVKVRTDIYRILKNMPINENDLLYCERNFREEYMDEIEKENVLNDNLIDINV